MQKVITRSLPFSVAIIEFLDCATFRDISEELLLPQMERFAPKSSLNAVNISSKRSRISVPDVIPGISRANLVKIVLHLSDIS